MGFYDARAAEARSEAKSNIWWMWFNIVFFVVNALLAARGTSIWWLNATVAVLMVILAVLMFVLSKRNKALAVRWDELSRSVEVDLW